MENAMRSLTSSTAVIAFATATFFAHPVQAMTIAIPTGLSAAIQQSDVKQNVHWRRGYWGYSYYRPYAYVYRPYYAYAYRPYYAYTYRPYYAYRPYAYSYAYRPYYGAYAYGGYRPRIWIGWGRRWW